MRLVLLTICTLGIAGCTGNAGAVSVRWRIVDLSVGYSYDPKHDSDASGACCPSAHVVNHKCDFASPWVIPSLAVTLADPATGEAQTSDRFSCSVGETTTSFTQPVGTWAIQLAVDATTGAGLATATAVPPPEIHTITRGDIVNLPEIEIGVNLLTQPPPVPLPGPSPMVTF